MSAVPRRLAAWPWRWGWPLALWLAWLWGGCQNPIWLEGLPCSTDPDCASPRLTCRAGTCAREGAPSPEVPGQERLRPGETSISEPGANEPGDNASERRVEAVLERPGADGETYEGADDASEVAHDGVDEGTSDAGSADVTSEGPGDAVIGLP